MDQTFKNCEIYFLVGDRQYPIKNLKATWDRKDCPPLAFPPSMALGTPCKLEGLLVEALDEQEIKLVIRARNEYGRLGETSGQVKIISTEPYDSGMKFFGETKLETIFSWYKAEP